MKPTQEQATKRAIKSAILSLQSLDVLLVGVFARDDQSSENDGYSSSSLGGGSGGKGGHSDRTSDHAIRDSMSDSVHQDVVKIVEAVDLIKQTAQRIEKSARKLTAHDRRVIA